MSATQELIKEVGLLSYMGIWFVSIISNVVIPVPEEVVLLVLGYLSGGPKLDGVLLLPVVLSGLLVSDIAMYFFARRGNKLVSTFYDKVFASRIESKREWIDRNINKVIFFSRFLIQLRFLGPFFAGQTKMPFRKFFFLDLAALLVYVPLYLFIGWYFRNRIDFIAGGVNKVRNIIIIVALSLVLFSIFKFLRNYILKNKLKNPHADDK